MIINNICRLVNGIVCLEFNYKSIKSRKKQLWK